MPRLPRDVTGVELAAVLRRAGWYIHEQVGGHAQLRHPDRPGAKVTVPIHRQPMRPKTLASALAQASMTVEEFLKWR